jgi:hypothetical protein
MKLEAGTIYLDIKEFAIYNGDEYHYVTGISTLV